MPDPNLCVVCEHELEDLRPFQRDIHGNGTHLECLPEPPEEDDPDAD